MLHLLTIEGAGNDLGSTQAGGFGRAGERAAGGTLDVDTIGINAGRRNGNSSLSKERDGGGESGKGEGNHADSM